jgi:hypothetical protein
MPLRQTEKQQALLISRKIFKPALQKYLAPTLPSFLEEHNIPIDREEDEDAHEYFKTLRE